VQGLLGFYRSTIGKKVVMALTGLVWLGYVAGHLAGNLLVYRGPDAINNYAAFLHSTLPLLWGTRVLLVISLVLHVHAALGIRRLDRLSRPQGYAGGQRYLSSNVANRFMGVGGVVLLAFLLWHLADLTLGWVNPDFSHSDVYGNLMASLSVTWVAAFYVVGTVALALHIYHGAWSMFQSVGVNHPKIERGRRLLATALAILLPVGFASIPVAIAFGLIGG